MTLKIEFNSLCDFVFIKNINAKIPIITNTLPNTKLDPKNCVISFSSTIN